jgi:hypothetical protein
VATPLNKVPPGLLDFFGIKSGEWGPRELGQQLQPTIDLARWYLDQYAINVVATVVGSPFGNLAPTNVELSPTTPTDISGLVVAGSLRVPQTELWLILQADVSWTLAAQAGGRASAILASGTTLATTPSFTWPMTTSGHVTSDAAIAMRGHSTLRDPFWIQGGDRISCGVQGIVSAAGGCALDARLRLMRFLR